MTIIAKFDPEEPRRALPKKYIGLGLFVLFVLTLAQVWASNNVVTYGEKLEELSALSKTLSLENQILENEIAGRESLNNIASKSADLGFSEPESIQYIR